MPVRISVEIVQNTGTRKNAVTPRAMSASTFMQKADGQYDANSMLRSVDRSGPLPSAADMSRSPDRKFCRTHLRPPVTGTCICNHRYNKFYFRKYSTFPIYRIFGSNLAFKKFQSSREKCSFFFGFYFLDKTTVN